MNILTNIFGEEICFESISIIIKSEHKVIFDFITKY